MRSQDDDLPDAVEPAAEAAAVGEAGQGHELEHWQRSLRVGDCFVAALRGGGRCTFAWVSVLEAREGSSHLRGRSHSGDAPCGVVESVARASAVFPLSREQFAVARQAGWPDRLSTVQAIARLARGGSA